MNEERVTYFAYTDSRNKRIPFGIKAKDRTRHVYVIGKTGMGKSTLLENMAVQDIKNGEGLAFIDPHGKTAELLLDYVPEHRLKDVVYFAPFDTDHPISFNVLESVDADKRHLVVSGLMSTFKKIWQDAWSARMEYILTNTLLALLEYPGATLLGVNRMLSDKDYRKAVVNNVTDPSVKSFWVDEFAKYTERMAAEAVPAIQNKIGQFTANALIRNMIGQPTSSFNIREIMDQGKIMIINLSKGRIGESNANLLGGMLITKIYLGAMSRADVPDRVLKTLPNFYLFVDEFQNFANESFADILSEARKYKLNLTIAHQYIEQMEEEVRAAVFGNVGTMISFRVGAFDAEVLEKEFAPQFTAEDIVNLGFAQIYLKLMIDGISSSPFSALTMEPIKLPEVSLRDKVIEESRKQFARTRASVEEAIVDWHKPVSVASAPSSSARSTSGTSSQATSQAAQGTPASALEIPTGRRMSGPDDPKTVKEMLRTMEPVRTERAEHRDTHTGHKAEKPVHHTASHTPQPAKQKPLQASLPNSAAPLPPRKVPLLAPEDEPTEGFVSLKDIAPAKSAPRHQAQPQSKSHHEPQHQSKAQNTQKVATPKNIGDLRSALAQLVKIEPQKKAESQPSQSPHVSHTPRVAAHAAHTPEKAAHKKEEKPHNTPPEVPRDVLTNLLKVEHNSETTP